MTGFLVKLVLKLCSLFSLRGAQGLGSFLGYLAYLIPNRVKHVALRNIELCFPELDPVQQRVLCRQSLLESAKAMTELGVLWKLDHSGIKQRITQVHNEHLMMDGAASGRGLLCLTPHLGNWEIVNQYFSVPYLPLSLYRPPRIESLHKTLLAARTKLGARMAPANTSGIKAVMRALRAGEVVGILPDQDPGKDQGIYVPFFNHPCNTMPLITKLIQKTNPLVIFIYAVRLPRGQGYEMFLEAAPDAIYNPDPVVATTALNQAIEAIVRRAPEQYQWTYKRFKYQPDNSKLYE